MLKILTWNVYGAVRGGDPTRGDPPPSIGINQNGFRFVDVLADRIAAERPHLVGLQELCGSQASALGRRLADRGYPMALHFKIGKEGERRCPDPEPGDEQFAAGTFGKAVLAQGVATPQDAALGVDTCVLYELPEAAGTEPVRFCSIHTDPAAIPNVATTLNIWADEGPVIAVGDYNATPEDSVMDLIYRAEPADQYTGSGKFYEADQECALPGCKRTNEESTHVTIGDIDHVFISHQSLPKDDQGQTLLTASSWLDVPHCQRFPDPELCSDHSMVWAEMQLRLGEASRPAPGRGDLGNVAGDWTSEGQTLTFGSDGTVSYSSEFCACSNSAKLEPLDESQHERRYKATFDWSRLDNVANGPLYFAFYKNAAAPSGVALNVDGHWIGSGEYTRK